MNNNIFIGAIYFYSTIIIADGNLLKQINFHWYRMFLKLKPKSKWKIKPRQKAYRSKLKKFTSHQKLLRALNLILKMYKSFGHGFIIRIGLQSTTNLFVEKDKKNEKL